jgi:hypothetical protein
MPQPVRLYVFVLVMLSQPHAIAEDFRLPPVRWWGEIGYDYRLEAFEEGDDLSEHAGILSRGWLPSKAGWASICVEPMLVIPVRITTPCSAMLACGYFHRAAFPSRHSPKSPAAIPIRI